MHRTRPHLINLGLAREVPRIHAINPTNLHFSPFLHKGTATTHQMREEIVNKPSLPKMLVGVRGNSRKTDLYFQDEDWLGSRNNRRYSQIENYSIKHWLSMDLVLAYYFHFYADDFRVKLSIGQFRTI